MAVLFTCTCILHIICIYIYTFIHAIYARIWDSVFQAQSETGEPGTFSRSNIRFRWKTAQRAPFSHLESAVFLEATFLEDPYPSPKKKYPLPVSPDSEYFCSELTQVFSRFLFASSTGSSGPQGSRTCCLLLTKWQRFGNPTVCHWTPWPESPAFARSNMYPSDPELHIAIENGPRNS